MRRLACIQVGVGIVRAEVALIPEHLYLGLGSLDDHGQRLGVAYVLGTLHIELIDKLVAEVAGGGERIPIDDVFGGIHLHGVDDERVFVGNDVARGHAERDGLVGIIHLERKAELVGAEHIDQQPFA